MSPRKSLLGCLLVSTILVLHQVLADVETNEVDTSGDVYSKCPRISHMTYAITKAPTIRIAVLQGVRVYPNDRQCVLVGGLCVETKDCLEPTSNRGLCPSSAGQEVECCYERE